MAIRLSSAEGQRLLKKCHENSDNLIQPHLVRLFRHQQTNVTCAVASAAMCLNARHVGETGSNAASQEGLPHQEEKLMVHPKLASVIDVEKLQEGGMTLDESLNIYLNLGYEAKRYHASDVSVDELRKIAVDVLSAKASERAIVMNYHLNKVGFEVYFGHFSPLGAYDRDSDRFLILDTYLDTESVWVTTDMLFDAINTVDDCSGKLRGFITIA